MKRYRLPISLIRNLGRPVRRLRPTKMRIRYQSQGEETTLQEGHEQAHAQQGAAESTTYYHVPTYDTRMRAALRDGGVDDAATSTRMGSRPPRAPSPWR